MFEVEVFIQWTSQWQVSFSSCTVLYFEIIFSGENILMNKVHHQAACIANKAMWLPSIENFLK